MRVCCTNDECWAATKKQEALNKRLQPSTGRELYKFNQFNFFSFFERHDDDFCFDSANRSTVSHACIIYSISFLPETLLRY